MKALALYIHIPFCKRKCGYCDFYSICNENLIPTYSEALQKSLEYHGKKCSADYEIQSIYFGGGTANLPATKELQSILESIQKNFVLAKNIESTIEINPEFSQSKMALGKLRNLGFNRLSIGIQSLKNKELRFLGRFHTSRTALRSLKNARDIFDNISVDLIYAIPKQSLADLQSSLDSILNFSPEHISAYNLSCEEGTALAKSVEAGKVRLASEEIEREQFLFLHEYLQDKSYEHYEISNFAKPGFHSRHNSSYWTQKDYLGIGPSAHSMLENTRYHYAPDIKGFIENPLNFHGKEAAQESESIISTLRTSRGLDLKILREESRNRILQYAKEHPHWLSIHASRAFCSLEGWLMLDSILLDLI